MSEGVGDDSGLARQAERFRRVRAVFGRVHALPPGERPAAIDEACGDDADLQAEVESLLREDEPAGERLDPAAVAPLLRSALEAAASNAGGPDVPETPDVPDRLGPFRILRVLGAGGMAVVYEAEQPLLHRRVALKVLRHGMLSDEARRRFLKEAEILGKLSHPGIARVLEAGVEDLGRGVSLPWFALELIDGRTPTERARALGLSLRDRVALLLQVADAVAHAHDQGIVHRDLKPANVLVDDAGHAYVLDFGIARLLDTEPAASLLTRSGDVLGTLAYMSPEQAAGSPADERADVHALGVLAFELLTGRLPRDVAELALPEALRVVLEEDAPSPRSLDRELPRDLDAIVGKALEREPEDRYRCAAELAADLRRWLSHQTRHGVGGDL